MRITTLKDYLKEYGQSPLQTIADNKSFYDKYIEWGKEKDYSDTILSPQAIKELAKVYEAESFDNNSKKIVEGKEKMKNNENDTSVPSETVPRKRGRKKGVKVSEQDKENIVAKDAKNIDIEKDQIDISAYMAVPEEVEKIPSTKENQGKELKNNFVEQENEREKKVENITKNKKTRTKKNKLALSKEKLSEFCSGEVKDIKVLRQFLMEQGFLKVEEVALMSDKEIEECFEKEFYIIPLANGKVLFAKKAALEEVLGEMYLI